MNIVFKLCVVQKIESSNMQADGAAVEHGEDQCEKGQHSNADSSTDCVFKVEAHKRVQFWNTSLQNTKSINVNRLNRYFNILI